MDPAFRKPRPWNEGRVLFDFAIDGKLRGCDVVKVRIGNIVSGGRIRDRAIVVQQKTKRPVQFELLDPARKNHARKAAASGAGRSTTTSFRAGTITWRI